MVKVNKFIFWTPRILSILFILFLALFSFDVFDSCSGFSGCALALFMHNLPSIVLLILLIISWKHELVGAITFISAGILYTSLCIVRFIMGSPKVGYMLSWPLTIAVPAFLVGILFLIGWRRKKIISKKKNPKKQIKKLKRK